MSTAHRVAMITAKRETFFPSLHLDGTPHAWERTDYYMVCSVCGKSVRSPLPRIRRGWQVWRIEKALRALPRAPMEDTDAMRRIGTLRSARIYIRGK